LRFRRFPAASKALPQKGQSVVEIGVTQDLESKPARLVFVESGNTRVFSGAFVPIGSRVHAARDRIALENAAPAGQ